MLLEIHQFLLCMFLGLATGIAIFIYSEINDKIYRFRGSFTGGSRIIQAIFMILIILFSLGLYIIW